MTLKKELKIVLERVEESLKMFGTKLRTIKLEYNKLLDNSNKATGETLCYRCLFDTFDEKNEPLKIKFVF